MPDSSQYTRLDGEGGLVNSWRNGLTRLEKLLIVTTTVGLVTIVTMAVVLARCQSHVHPNPEPSTTVTPVPTNGTTLPTTTPTPKPTTNATTPKPTTQPTTPKPTSTVKPAPITTQPTTTTTVKANEQNGVLTPELHLQSNESSTVTETFNETTTQIGTKLIPQPKVVLTNISTVEVERNVTDSSVKLPGPKTKEAAEITQIEISSSNITSVEAKLSNNSSTYVSEDLTKTVQPKIGGNSTI